VTTRQARLAHVRAHGRPGRMEQPLRSGQQVAGAKDATASSRERPASVTSRLLLSGSTLERGAGGLGALIGTLQSQSSQRVSSAFASLIGSRSQPLRCEAGGLGATGPAPCWGLRRSNADPGSLGGSLPGLLLRQRTANASGSPTGALAADPFSPIAGWLGELPGRPSMRLLQRDTERVDSRTATRSGRLPRRDAATVGSLPASFAVWSAPCRGLLGRALAAPLLALLWVYRRFVSPALPPSCRYYPSCSAYTEEAVRVHGPARGLWLAAGRLLRCHPFCEGGPDPVPPREPARTPHPRSA
jgi:putative membrane protein insertion efficiency factor